LLRAMGSDLRSGPVLSDGSPADRDALRCGSNRRNVHGATGRAALPADLSPRYRRAARRRDLL